MIRSEDFGLGNMGGQRKWGLSKQTSKIAAGINAYCWKAFDAVLV